MPITPLLPILEEVAKLMPIAIGVVAISAFIIGFAQWNTVKRHHRESNARAVWREYEKISIEYPLFSDMKPENFDFENRTLDGDKASYLRYEWYLSFMLLACEEAMVAFRDQKDWRNSVMSQLGYHAAFICSERFDALWKNNMRPELRQLVDEECRRVSPSRMVVA